MDPDPAVARLAFRDVVLVPEERLVFKAGDPVRLTPKAFDLLVVLATNPGRLLTKEQLMQAVWGETAVEESNLSYHVFAIRKALGDTAENGHLIETVPRRGYRFTPTVQRLEAGIANVRNAAADETQRHATVGPDTAIPSPTVPQDSIPPFAPADHRRLQRGALTGATAALVVVLAGVWMATRPASRSAENLEPLRAMPLLSMGGVVREPSLSPDGTYVVFSWTGKEGNRDLYVQHIGSGELLRLTSDPANDYSPAWSPDGRHVAFLRRVPGSSASEIRLVPALGGEERKVADVQPRIHVLRPNALSWCPDSACVVVTDSPGAGQRDGVFAVAIDSGQKRQLTYPPAEAGADTDPVISPDGRVLVFRRDGTPFSGAFHRLALNDGPSADGEPVRVTTTLQAGKPAWTPDGRQIVFSSRGGLWRLDLSTGAPPTRLPFIGEDGLTPVIRRTADGRQRLVYIRSFSDANIWRIDVSAPGMAASTAPVIAVSTTRSDSIASLSPAGDRLAFLSNRTGEFEIWVANPDGSQPVQLTHLGKLPGFPRWSPDGRLLAFHGDPNDRPDVLLVAATGGTPTVLTSRLPNSAFPSFSRDGSWVYFGMQREEQSRIWKMPVAGGDAIQVTTHQAMLAIESPDHRDLYFVEAVDRPSGLWRLPLAGGVPVKVVDGVVSGGFDVVDQGVYYLDRVLGGADSQAARGSDIRLRYLDFETRQSTTVAGNLGLVAFGLSASRDGRTVFFSRVDSAVDELMLVENFR